MQQPETQEPANDLSNTFYAAVRKSDGREWIDPSSIHLLRMEAWSIAKAMDLKLPAWAEGNPTQRIARIEIRLAPEAPAPAKTATVRRTGHPGP